MNILYDYRAYQNFSQRGIGRYINEIYSRLLLHTNTNHYILYNSEHVLKTISLPPNSSCSFITPDALDNLNNNFFDVYINGAAFSLGILPQNVIEQCFHRKIIELCKIKLCIIYDFIPLFFHDYINSEQSKLSFLLQHELLNLYDHFFTDSITTLVMANTFLDIPYSRFTCIYGGADETKFHPRPGTCAYSAESRTNNIVYVSGEAPQKNNKNCVIAFCTAMQRGIIPRDAKLYIVCRASEEFKNNINNIAHKYNCLYPDNIEATGYISDTEMLELISTARASFFPSYLEGLGLPILESYAAGTPCWASNSSATSEFVLDDCSFDPFDIESMVKAFVSIYSDDMLGIKSIEFGKKMLKTVNWDCAAQRVREIIIEKTSK